VLAQYHPTRVSASKAAAIAGYSVRSSTWRNILSRLRQAGHIEQGPEPYAITPAGFATLGDWQPLPTGAALLEHWMARVGKGDRETLRILATLRGECPSSDLAERAGYSPSSSTWRNILSRLRILGLIEGSRNIKLHEDLR
jgi:DNA-binding IclR family transcriptional regulator